MNRGSCYDEGHAKMIGDASMRPRFMNRGSAKALYRVIDGPPRFNEAPIHESGKSRCHMAVRNSGQRASMRPRFMNRGSHRQAIPSRMGRRGFNEAPIHESGK